MTLLLLYVAVALTVSFVCSVLEAVLLSITPAYIAAGEQEGRADTGRLRSVKENIDRPLAAILSLNTIAHTVGAAGASAPAGPGFRRGGRHRVARHSGPASGTACTKPQSPCGDVTGGPQPGRQRCEH